MASFDEEQVMVVAAAALLDEEGRVLVQRRPPGKPMAGLWEFPGGKLEPGESPRAGLARELAEELRISVALSSLEPVTFAAETLEDRDLLLLLFVCRHWQGKPMPLAATELTWMSPEALDALAMPPADLPLVAALRSTVGRSRREPQQPSYDPGSAEGR